MEGEGIKNMRYYGGLWSSKGHHIYINIYGRGWLVGKKIYLKIFSVDWHEKIKVEKHCIISFDAHNRQ